MKKLILSFTVVLFCTSCVSHQASKSKTVILEKNTTNKTINLKVGESVKVEAESNPSTGYNWHLEVPSDCSVEFLKEDAKAIYNDGRIGAPIKKIYEFKGTEKGTCEVEFDYSRAWEGKSNQPKKVKFIVN